MAHITRAVHTLTLSHEELVALYWTINLDTIGERCGYEDKEGLPVDYLERLAIGVAVTIGHALA